MTLRTRTQRLSSSPVTEQEGAAQRVWGGYGSEPRRWLDGVSVLHYRGPCWPFTDFKLIQATTETSEKLQLEE